MSLATKNQDQEFSTKGIKVVHLPPNMTFLIQPLDQWVPRNFKAHYMVYCTEKILNAMEETPNRENSLYACVAVLVNCLNFVVMFLGA